MLNDLDLKPVYDSSEYDIIDSLFCPLLKESCRYDRGVGYFSSSWLKLASEGLQFIANNGGKIRYVMSPILSKDDIQAINVGVDARENQILYKALEVSILDLEKKLKYETLNTLSWLIADEIIDIKLAISKSEGDFHDKFAIFEDTCGNRVAIHGSFNESAHASMNGESFSVFKSWEEGQKVYVEKHDSRFKDFWSDHNSQFKVYQFPDAVKEKLLKYRINNRPYSLNKKTDVNLGEILLEKEIPQIPFDIELRDYQNEAIAEWQKNGCQGLLEMATGTGKTVTSLAASLKIKENNNNKIFLVICVPQLHLINQWEGVVKKFGYPSSINCSSENSFWKDNLRNKITDFNNNTRDVVVVLTTHITATDEYFKKMICQIKPDYLMGIYDEVHALGAPKLRLALYDCLKNRLGLSATPSRWYDQAGTKIIESYFNKVCFQYPIEKAIGNDLVEYEYFPEIVELKEDEYSEYEKITERLKWVKGDSEDDNDKIKMLLIKRAKIINDAKAKVEIFKDIIHSLIDSGKISHTLVYAPSGNHSEYLKAVGSLNIKANEFIYTVTPDKREDLLRYFDKGDLDVLVAVNCLNEGVDVPSTLNAIFVSSSTNPREFIQRRGRVLRKCLNKGRAYIYDLIVFPPNSINGMGEIGDIGKSILRRELPRFAEMSKIAINSSDARNKLYPILEKMGLLYLMDKDPSDIYRENELLKLNDLEEGNYGTRNK